MAKRARELKVKERRALKLEKKYAAAAARKTDEEPTLPGQYAAAAAPKTDDEPTPGPSTD